MGRRSCPRCLSSLLTTYPHGRGRLSISNASTVPGGGGRPFPSRGTYGCRDVCIKSVVLLSPFSTLRLLLVCSCFSWAAKSNQAQRIAARRESVELELQHEIESEDAAELAATAALAASVSATDPDGGESLPAEDPAGGAETKSGRDGKSTAEGDKAVEVPAQETSNKEEGGTIKGESDRSDSEGGNCDDALNEEQRRLEELDKAEHEADMARLKK